MQKTKTFIAISSESFDGKLVLLNTSAGESLFNENGIHVREALDFLFSLIKHRKKTGVVFVCYAFSRDNEFIFSTLPSDLKDKLFQSERIKNKIENLALDTESVEDVYYSAELDSQEYEQADFERYVNHLSLTELKEVEYEDYKISLVNGKILTINCDGKSLSIYDIFGFFKPKGLGETANAYLDTALCSAFLDRNNLPLLTDLSVFERLRLHSDIEVGTIAGIATKLNIELQKIDINLSRFHGASAITSYWLTKYKARTQYHNYRFKRQHAPEYWKAKQQAFYPGRSEQLKLGTIKNVNVYDINSAYAFASTFLPVLLHKPFYSEEWQSTPFSCWLVDYDFSSVNSYFGLLPNRDFGMVRYKIKGKSYFWQPEVSWLMKHYPECIEVKGGFVYDYTPAPFAEGIEVLYNLRLELQRQGNPLEKVIKLALANFYGKFCQHNGKGHYYNLDYAGFITSLTRMQLLEATKGYERDTICFQTDAIHTTAFLPVSLSDSLGEWKISKFSRVTYLDNGVYQGRDNVGRITKTKTRGFRNFDFKRALAEIKDKRTYTALAEFFIGHNLFTRDQFKGVEYLADYKQPKTMTPVTFDRSAMRLFEVLDVDLTETFIDSRAVSFYNGKESGLYKVGNNRVADAGLDTIEAGRV